MDLEGEATDLGEAAYDVIVVFRYLHRPLFPALERALAPGGLLVYETFTRAQAAALTRRTRPFSWRRASCRGSSLPSTSSGTTRVNGPASSWRGWPRASPSDSARGNPGEAQGPVTAKAEPRSGGAASRAPA